MDECNQSTAYQFFIQQTFAQHEIGMRKVGDRFQHDLYSDIQVIIVMKLIYFEYCKVRFQIVRILLGLYFHVVFKCRQMLGIVSKSKRLNGRAICRKTRRDADSTMRSNDFTYLSMPCKSDATVCLIASAMVGSIQYDTKDNKNVMLKILLAHGVASMDTGDWKKSQVAP